MPRRLVSNWYRADKSVRDIFRFKFIAYILGSMLLIIHAWEVDFQVTSLDYVFAFIYMVTPLVMLLVVLNSSKMVKMTISTFSTDLFMGGWFVALMQFSIVPSIVAFIVTISDYVAGNGANKLYKFLYFPLGCIVPAMLHENPVVIWNGSVLEVSISFFFALISFTYIAYINYRVRKAYNQKTKALKEESEKLAEANRVKDRLFSIVSHDLKSPLSSLKGILFLLENDSLNGSERKDILKKINNQFNKTVDLTNNVLYWAKSQMSGIALAKSKVNLNQLTDTVSDHLKGLSDTKNLKIEQNVPELFVEADPNMLEVVIRNLLSNAIKFTPPEGTIKLSAQKDGDRIKYCVDDSGVGISEDVVIKLFNPKDAYSTRGTADEVGTGIGLFLCKEIIDQHKGSIWVDCKKENASGTRIYFEIPIKVD